jgi:hypothetical protein
MKFINTPIFYKKYTIDILLSERCMIISFYDAKEKTWMGLPLYITDNLHQNGLKAPALPGE